MSQTREPPLQSQSIFWRGSLATALTGLAAPLVFALGYIFVALLEQPERSSAGRMDFVSFTWFFGFILALPCAVLLGLMVEVPIARRAQKNGRAAPFLLHIALSVAASVGLLLTPWLLSLAGYQSARSRPDLIDDLLFFVGAGGIGGLCSACLWQGLVVGPAVRRR